MARTNPTPAGEEPQPATATPAAAPADLVRVKLAHFIDYGGKSYRPGDELEVPAATADSWVWGGFAQRVEAAQPVGEPKP